MKATCTPYSRFLMLLDMHRIASSVAKSVLRGMHVSLRGCAAAQALEFALDEWTSMDDGALLAHPTAKHLSTLHPCFS